MCPCQIPTIPPPPRLIIFFLLMNPNFSEMCIRYNRKKKSIFGFFTEFVCFFLSIYTYTGRPPQLISFRGLPSMRNSTPSLSADSDSGCKCVCYTNCLVPTKCLSCVCVSVCSFCTNLKVRIDTKK